MNKTLFPSLSTSCLAAILFSGFWLRFYHLGLPTMWLDEILVPMAAEHPLPYIVDLCVSSEVHPPFFYLLIKAVLLIGKSDGVLRILSAGFGLACLFAAFRLIRGEFDVATGSLYVALLACNPLHIYVSRVVRPYSVFIFAFVMAIIYLKRYVDRWEKKDLSWLLIFNLAMILFHYSSFLILATQAIIIFGFANRDAFGIRLKTIASYLAFSALSVAVVMPFFVARILNTHKEQFMGYDYPKALINILDKVIQTFYMFDNIPLRIVITLLFVAGCVFMLQRDRRRFFFFFTLFAGPVVLLCVSKYDYYAFNVWHLSFLTIPLLVFPAYALRCLLVRARAAVLVALVLAVSGTAFLFEKHYRDYFAWDTAIVPYYILSKPLAQNLPRYLDRDSMKTFSNSGMYNGYNWYRDQFVSFNNVKEQRLEPEEKAVKVQFITGTGNFGGLAKNETEFLEKYGPPDAVSKLFQVSVYDYLVKREPVTTIKALPSTWRAKIGLIDLYKYASRLENATLDTEWDGSIIPTANDVLSVVEYAFDNNAAAGPQLIMGVVDFSNAGRENEFTVKYKFDDQEFKTARRSIGKDAREEFGFVVEKATPYHRLVVRIEMVCKRYTALFPGGNLATISLKGLSLQMLPMRDAWLRKKEAAGE